MFNILGLSKKYIGGLILLIILLGSGFILTAYTDKNNSGTVHADSLQLNPFVEPDFPFISTSLDARKLGSHFPNDNISARSLALQLGDSAYACFDTDLLRWSVGWTGKFLPMVLMAQISYKDFFNKNNKITTVTGDPKIATGSYAGWSEGKPDFKDPREEPEIANEIKWGAMPPEKARWNGVYVYGRKSVLHYNVGKASIFEMPESMRFENETAFVRKIQIENADKELYLTAAEITDASAGEVKGKIAFIYHGSSKDTVTAVAVLGKGSLDMQPEVNNNRYLTVRISSASKKEEGTILIWKGPASKKKAFEKLCKKKHTAFPDFKKGGQPHWAQTVTTSGESAPDTAAYVTDKLTLPLNNPWKRNVRLADISFYDSGHAAGVTFEGDVWMIEGIDKNLKNIRWKRFASGLHEPMSIEVVRDTVYVFGREGIVRLHDLNNDGEADYYENFSNVVVQSPESREWAADMVYGPDGSFYVAKGGTQSNGPGVTSQIAKGFRAGSKHNGTILKILPDGRSFEVIATGLRGPYIGMHPEKGTLTASDQQGNFVPSTPIYLIKKGDYYGVPASAHRKDNPPIAPPLTWIPHRADRSSISQVWITGNKMGPLNENLIHFSFAHPGLFRVLIDSAAKITQGGVSFIQADYPAPTSKGAMNPVDGQLYVTGFNLWGSSSKGISALLRLRYTGKPMYLPNQFQAARQGIVLGFDTALDANLSVSDFAVKRWNYKRTEEYGSGHFKLDGTSGEETLDVAGVYLSSDRKKVLLLVPDMQEVMQMEVAYRIKASDGKISSDRFWFTINNLSDLKAQGGDFKNVDLSLLEKKKGQPEPESRKELTASVENGKDIFQKMACAGCHSAGLVTKGMYGPPFQNLYKSERHFEDGSIGIADEKYIRESILTPSVKIVKGYNEEMPSFVGILSETDIESVTLYIKSLKKQDPEKR
ncbi:Glucose/arabinose dehydrogenase, beta-propeller fold [Dyadobacter koreensis]|uniref:Glucose/arabinose dehydrogenase, beta-propeller fold n=1 Tax=Dyadobacter koreensis TaxID=408657 RepID=A0A1H6Q045_9BACT|nr:DUF6797 domain-containing protein [Dyadobacter koreensis]SEI37228.1 Glucose/arabinose dehydrogenase, beta-propeller fold [Dyadobacter koreensis]